MRELSVDVAIIGGGPAGLAAALEVAHRGRSCAILERNTELGGILQQCIHDGFGLLRFGESVSGCTYAQRFIDRLEAERAGGARIEVLLDTMVLELTESREIWATNPTDGMVHVRACAVILAMGCRERTAAQVLLHGERPQGVITAGAAQRYINVEGYLPGTRAVILGSGDIGLIMARRMTLEGIEVEGVYEIMDHPGGLARNVVQCLEDYGIPLHLSHM
ncbi:MAG: FAD-dependent oxidoreductase, partial [Atopobiaceae bacterium]|nr:FAD-dependent oxidoreductase [Atopobiaceae bacterium]